MLGKEPGAKARDLFRRSAHRCDLCRCCRASFRNALGGCRCQFARVVCLQSLLHCGQMVGPHLCDDQRRAVSRAEVSISAILKKNVARIAAVFLFWSGCYALVDLIFRHAPLSVVLSQLITGHYHLWFLYMIVGLYLLIPLLRPIVQNETLCATFCCLRFFSPFFSPSLPCSPPSFRMRQAPSSARSSCTPIAFFLSASPFILSAGIISAGGTSAAEKRSFSTASA